MRERLAAGDSLILFPEGTSTDGTRVLPFRSSFLAAAGAAAAVQPVSVGLRPPGRPAGLPARPAALRLVRRHGDRPPCLAAGAAQRGCAPRWSCTTPLPPGAFPDRKALAAAAQAAVAEGAATLRQNRPAAPLRAVPAGDAGLTQPPRLTRHAAPSGRGSGAMRPRTLPGWPGLCRLTSGRRPHMPRREAGEPRAGAKGFSSA